MQKNDELESSLSEVPIAIQKGRRRLFMHEIHCSAKTGCLTDEDLEVSLSQAKIQHLYKLFDHANYDVKYLALSSFFDGEAFFSFNNSLSLYNNNVFQYSLLKFMESIDYEITFETCVEYHGSAVPKKRYQECDLNKYFEVYTDALVFFKSKKRNDKIVISFDYSSYTGETHWDVYSNIDIQEFWKKLKDYVHEHNPYRNKKITADCSFLNINQEVTWDDVILPEHTLDVIRKNIFNVFQLKDLLRKNNISLKRGVIFSGSPGTGKTLLCRVLVKELDTTVIYVFPHNIERINDISRICQMARELSPTLLIIEDIDFLANDREQRGGPAVIELMNQMDGVENFGDIVTLATTNKVQNVEDAIKNRPGRFDRVINIDVPDDDTRMNMINKFCENFYLTKSINIKSLVNATEGMSGAYIKDLCTTAALLALQDGSVTKSGKATIKKQHFDDAVSEIKDKDFSSWQSSSLAPKKPMGFAAANVARPA